jgi:predicted adenylyl cyclase CyaB
MKEIEVKILEINRAKIEKTLADLKAMKVFEGEIITEFFDFGDGQIRKRRDVLRLRQIQGEVELTYKRIQINNAVKEAQEYSVKVSSMETTQSILMNLGLCVTEQMKKHRTSFEVGDVRFDIDRYGGKYSYIPEFLEIEGPEKEIKRFARALGFEDKDCLPWSTDELVNHYSAKKKLT